MRMFFDHVLLETIEKPKTTASGLHIVETKADEFTEELAARYTVIAYGPKCRMVTKDKVVAIKKYAGSAVEIDGVKFKVVKEEEILGEM